MDGLGCGADRLETALDQTWNKTVDLIDIFRELEPGGRAEMHRGERFDAAGGRF